MPPWVSGMEYLSLMNEIATAMPPTAWFPTDREMLVEVKHPRLGIIKMLGFPAKLSKTPGKVITHPPTLGQHTEEVLTTLLGYCEEQILKLKSEKVIE